MKAKGSVRKQFCNSIHSTPIAEKNNLLSVMMIHANEVYAIQQVSQPMYKPRDLSCRSYCSPSLHAIFNSNKYNSKKKNHHGLVGKNTSTRAWHTEQDFSSHNLLHKELRIWSLSAASCVVDLTLSNVWFHGNWADCKSSTSHKIAMLLPAEMCFSLDSMLTICQVETHCCVHLQATAHDRGIVLSSSQTLWCSYYV